MAAARDYGTVWAIVHRAGSRYVGSLVATSSLLSRVIESYGQDVKIVSIRDRVQLGTGDKGCTVHADGSLRYRGWVVVP